MARLVYRNWSRIGICRRGVYIFTSEPDFSYGNENDVQALKERRISKPEPTPSEPTIDYLLSYQTFMQRESAQRDEIISTILEPTAMQTLALDRARAQSVEQTRILPVSSLLSS